MLSPRQLSPLLANLAKMIVLRLQSLLCPGQNHHRIHSLNRHRLGRIRQFLVTPPANSGPSAHVCAFGLAASL